jgi:hypothetical protein
MELQYIKSKPQTHNNTHESIYRSYSVLDYVLKMVERGDSKETIIEIATFLMKDDTETINVCNHVWEENMDNRKQIVCRKCYTIKIKR